MTGANEMMAGDVVWGVYEYGVDGFIDCGAYRVEAGDGDTLALTPVAGHRKEDCDYTLIIGEAS